MKKITILLLIISSSMNLNAQQPVPPPSITVMGEGIVKVVPDRVMVRVSVEHSGNEATEVKQENDHIISEVLQFCKKMKIESRHLKTNRINLNKNYDYQLKKYKYVASQSISIQLNDLKKYEELMQGLLTSGINRIDGVTFESSKSDDLQAEARKKAILNAKMKATEYASAVGQEVGRAVYISEGSTAPQPPLPMYRASMAVQSTAVEKETLAPGEMEIAVKVNVVFELK